MISFHIHGYGEVTGIVLKKVVVLGEETTYYLMDNGTLLKKCGPTSWVLGRTNTWEWRKMKKLVNQDIKDIRDDLK